MKVTRLKEVNPQAIYLVANVPELSLFLKQAKELNFDIQIYGTDPVEDPELIKLVGKLANGITYLVSKEALNEKFIQAFTEKYGQTPAVSADEAYDAVMLLAKAIEVCGT